MTESVDRHPSAARRVAARPGGPDISDPQQIGRIAAGQLRNVAAFLERSAQAIDRQAPPPAHLVQSLADSAMHVRLTAEAVQHLCQAAGHEAALAPRLALVPGEA